MFVINQPDVFFKHQGVFEKHQDRFINHLRERCLTPKGALTNTQGSENLYLRERKPTLS
jgi:hypothetical protein